MHERKEGTLRSGRSGKKVTSRQQAIAIGLAEATKLALRSPKKQATAEKKTTTKKKAPRKEAARKK